MNASKTGLLINFVNPGSPAHKAGLRKGDTVVSVDGKRVSDGIEFAFFCAQPHATIGTIREGAPAVRTMIRPPGKESGIRFRDAPIMRCGNRCIFCFIDQMPRGLRKSLYIKDEDYRHSFANGNYITLSHTPWSRLERIAELGLSPVYVSVHATDRAVRGNMLGNPAAFDIMEQLHFLERRSILFHTQIVVCPGINDGRVLKKTIRDLLTLGNGLLSIAVVPVGLTRHREIPLVPVDGPKALRICREIARISDCRAAAEGKRRIFCADELFIKAELPIPHKNYYEDYPQIENGVGLVRQLLEEWRYVKKRLALRIKDAGEGEPNCLKGQGIVITSQSAYLFIRNIIDDLQKLCAMNPLDVVAVRNLFFGETVTVAGLMTGRDVIHAVKGMGTDYQWVILPRVMFNIRGYTLDGYSKQRIEKMLGFRVKIASTIKELADYVLGSQ